MKRTWLGLSLLAGGCLFAADINPAQAISGDGNWPRDIDSGEIHLVLYQPQVDSWRDNRIEARSAVIVTRKEDPAQIFGIVAISARTEVDRESRMVLFDDIAVKDANFPSARALQPLLLNAVRESVPDWPQAVSLDRVLADLAITQAETKAELATLKNDPPKIIFSKQPAALILIDGEPVYRPVQGTRYTRVINTPALLLFDSTEARFYLDGEPWWMTASNLTGPWNAAANPPADLDAIRQESTQGEQREPGAPAAVPGTYPPAVYVSTVPAELLVTRGEPMYTPIAKTSLLYVTNTDSDIFTDTRTQQYYTLLAGRWYRAASLEGPWDWTPGDKLPRDFSKIPPGTPKGDVLASIPGTEQAREAVIENQIPQTATVRRKDAKLEVRYHGDPEFRPIVGTPMEYAINTSEEVVYAEGRYYAVQHGIWFVADDPLGPWSVADMIPAVIYTIPPDSPLYHVRYAYVYGATPDFVYVGYTPGYMGAFVSGGVVVFGTGWRYPGVICGDFWCGWPWTWGFGFEFSYWGGGWFWRPVGHYWWYHEMRGTRRMFTEHWGPRWGGPPNRAWIRGNVNAYSRWDGNAVVARTFEPRRAPSRGPAASRPDVYAGRDGGVYQHRDNGWYRQNPKGQWQKAPSNRGLEQQRQSRTLGQSRQGEFERRGQSPGVPRTTAPPRATAPPRQSAPPRSAPPAGGRRR